MAMYAAYAIGAAVGVTVYMHQKFVGIALATALVRCLPLAFSFVFGP